MPIPPSILTQACQFYNTSSNQLIPLSGGFSNAVYKFPLLPPQPNFTTSQATERTPEPCKYGVLRIGVEDSPADQTLGMLEWVQFLNEHGAPVYAPLLSINCRLLEHLELENTQYVITAYEAAEGTLAERIPPANWTEDLFRRIGAAVGKFHRISYLYPPSNLSLTRPMWFDSYEIREATALLTKSADPTLDKLTALVNKLKQLPSSDAEVCLIHDDLHFANFLIQTDGQPIIIDFDDCLYGWPAIDIAMALFDVLVLFNPSSETEKQTFARHFLTNYLAGYRTEKGISAYWLNQIPSLLELKELCIYATLIDHADKALPDSWVGRFMRGRSERIAGDVPYVAIDYASL
jgi:Ser/Thr protein kinase RdoA (MazF antagonist)